MSGVIHHEKDKKTVDNGEHINLKVKGQVATGENSKEEDEGELFFRIKRTTKLRKLMKAYCDRHSVDFNAFAFLFDRHCVRAEQTPAELEMEDGDEIDAMLWW